MLTSTILEEESEETSSEEESVDVPVARRKFADEEDSDDVWLLRDKPALTQIIDEVTGRR